MKKPGWKLTENWKSAVNSLRWSDIPSRNSTKLQKPNLGAFHVVFMLFLFPDLDTTIGISNRWIQSKYNSGQTISNWVLKVICDYCCFTIHHSLNQSHSKLKTSCVSSVSWTSALPMLLSSHWPVIMWTRVNDSVCPQLNVPLLSKV